MTMGLDEFTSYMLGYCAAGIGDDTYYLSQFLDDIEPQDKQKIVQGVLRLFAEVNPQYLRYVYEDFVEREGTPLILRPYSQEQMTDAWERTRDLRTQARGYAV